MKVNNKIIKPTIALALMCIALFAVTEGALSATLQVSNNGNINAVGIGVYQDSACTVPLTSIGWNIDPGTSITKTAYLKNTKNTDISITVATSNWIGTPTNTTTVITLIWNTTSTLIAGQSAPITFTLIAAVNTGTLETFSFNTQITGTKL